MTHQVTTDKLIQTLENAGVEFDAEVPYGWYWIKDWQHFNGDVGFMTKELCALDAAATLKIEVFTLSLN
jgi:hypothetical protein